MNKSECLQADWRTVGFEDGTKGNSLSYVGYRRKDCAEYGVTLDLEQYTIGREAGLQQYCTYNKGYRHGSYGFSFSDVCQGVAQGLYQDGYNRGSELYALEKEVEHMIEDLNAKKAQFAALQQQIQRVEAKLISPAGSMQQRKKQLHRYNHFKDDRDALDHEIYDLELLVARKQQECDALRSQYSY